ncbi:FecR family protein [Flectobacillus roseus]|uniref:FecR family protein n=1 Tax=Flectobacillus roseus TaxID=502259 RepID=UPI0024B69A1A|nr:FecR family protein [Flectobacillus roseus]MDI9870090.1 FecR family protein [Flectobacillus roseus]
MSHPEFKDDDEIIKSLREKYTPEEIEKLLVWYDAFDEIAPLEEDLPKIEKKVWESLQTERGITPDAEEEEIQGSGWKEWWKQNWMMLSAAAAVIAIIIGIATQPQSKGDIESLVGIPQLSTKEKSLWETVTNVGKAIQEVSLPDGSKVWLNPSTSIMYKIVKGAPTREVYLEGEAFFDVKPNKDQPFHVKNKGLNIMVLGTSFNVVASANTDKYEVSVVTGKVRVNYQEDEDKVNQVIITPQQQVVIQKEENTVETHDFTVEQHTHKQIWEPITLSFDEVILDKVIEQIEDEYGIIIRTPNTAIRKCTLFGNFKNQRLPVIMDIICSSISATYQIEGNEIIILGDGCQ